MRLKAWFYTNVIDMYIYNAKIKSFCENYVERLIASNHFIKRFKRNFIKDKKYIQNLKIKSNINDISYTISADHVYQNIDLILDLEESRIKDMSRIRSYINRSNNIYLKCIYTIIKK